MTRAVRIKPLPSTRRVLVAVERINDMHQASIEAGLHVVGAIVGRRVKRFIREGPKTGRVYRVRGRDHQASAPGEAPANMTGKLARSYNYNVHGPYSMEIGESAEYAGFLEDGTGKMRPRPHFGRAVDATQGDVVTIFYDEFRKLER